jgi:hypothetical protein
VVPGSAAALDAAEPEPWFLNDQQRFLEASSIG